MIRYYVAQIYYKKNGLVSFKAEKASNWMDFRLENLEIIKPSLNCSLLDDIICGKIS